jgi:DNA-binding MarR family transcriptional regulator
MNAIFFGAKRAFHGILRVTRRPLQSLGLTAARFDLLFTLLEGHAAGSTRQSDLRRTLGVTAPTVSRMVRSLEQLGLVTRERSPYDDRRQRWVRLTDAGLQRIRHARRALLRAAKRLLCQAITFGKHRDPDECFFHMCTLESYLHGMREEYGDTARRLYPWHPDD